MNLSDIFSSVSSTVFSVCSTIGRVVSNFCTTVLPSLANLAIDAVRGIGNTIGDIAKVLGIFNGDEKIDDIGERALHAAAQNIKPENFDKYEQYIEEIRNFEIDSIKAQKFTSEQKSVAGMAVAIRGMEDKYRLPEGALNELPLLILRAPEYFTAERLTSILAITGDIPTIIEYFDNKLGRTDKTNVESIFIQAEQCRNPEKTYEEIKSEINAVAAAVAAKTYTP